MVKDKELLDIEEKVIKMMNLRKEKKKRFQELENNNLVKEYLSLIKENEELDEKIENLTKDYVIKKMAKCPHETFIFDEPKTINYYDDFLELHFICPACNYEINFITDISCDRIDLDYSNEERLFSIIKNHNIITSYGNTKEEVEEFFKEYIDRATFEGVKEANEYALTRKRKFK